MHQDFKSHYFDCQCGDFNHVIRFLVDDHDGDVWVEVNLNSWNPWHKRLWDAVLYVFGVSSRGSHYDTTMLEPRDIQRLRELLDRCESIKLSYRKDPLVPPPLVP